MKGATAWLSAVYSAAERCDRDGWERTRLADVASDVGIARGSLYRYFPTKDDLGLAVVEHGTGRWTAAARTASEATLVVAEPAVPSQGVLRRLVRTTARAEAPSRLGATLGNAALQTPSVRVVTALAAALGDGPHADAVHALVEVGDTAVAEAVEQAADLAFRAAVARERSVERGRTPAGTGDGDDEAWASRTAAGAQLDSATQLALARVLRAAAAEVRDRAAVDAFARLTSVAVG